MLLTLKPHLPHSSEQPSSSAPNGVHFHLGLTGSTFTPTFSPMFSSRYLGFSSHASRGVQTLPSTRCQSMSAGGRLAAAGPHLSVGESVLAHQGFQNQAGLTQQDVSSQCRRLEAGDKGVDRFPFFQASLPGEQMTTFPLCPHVALPRHIPVVPLPTSPVLMRPSVTLDQGSPRASC